MSQFTADTLGGALAQLRERRGKLERLISEARDIDAAIRELERVCRKLGVDITPRPRAVPSPREQRPPQEGTNADRALNVLREHPRGLATSVIMREAGIAQGSVSVVLQTLADKGRIVKVGRGFWRVAEAEQRAA